MASEDYLKKLQDPRWQKKRLEIFARDDFECQKCGRDNQTLVVHHRKYLSGREPWEYENNLLLTMCRECHEAEKDISKECQKLISILKTKFSAEDISSLALAFSNLKIIENSSVTAEMISVVLEKYPEVFKEKYLKFISGSTYSGKNKKIKEFVKKNNGGTT
jgi:hypothetical protein